MAVVLYAVSPVEKFTLGRSPTSEPSGFCRPCFLLNGLKMLPEVEKSGGSQRPVSLMCSAWLPLSTGGLGKVTVICTSPRPSRKSAVATSRPLPSRTSALAPTVGTCAWTAELDARSAKWLGPPARTRIAAALVHRYPQQYSVRVRGAAAAPLRDRAHRALPIWRTFGCRSVRGRSAVHGSARVVRTRWRTGNRRDCASAGRALEGGDPAARDRTALSGHRCRSPRARQSAARRGAHPGGPLAAICRGVYCRCARIGRSAAHAVAAVVAACACVARRDRPAWRRWLAWAEHDSRVVAHGLAHSPGAAGSDHRLGST